MQRTADQKVGGRGNPYLMVLIALEIQAAKFLQRCGGGSRVLRGENTWNSPCVGGIN